MTARTSAGALRRAQQRSRAAGSPRTRRPRDATSHGRLHAARDAVDAGGSCAISRARATGCEGVEEHRRRSRPPLPRGERRGREQAGRGDGREDGPERRRTPASRRRGRRASWAARNTLKKGTASAEGRRDDEPAAPLPRPGSAASATTTPRAIARAGTDELAKTRERSRFPRRSSVHQSDAWPRQCRTGTRSPSRGASTATRATARGGAPTARAARPQREHQGERPEASCRSDRARRTGGSPPSAGPRRG